MARKSYHGKVGVKFKAPYTTSKNKSMLRNVVTDLIIHGRVEVTLSTAKELAPLADEMVTLAKRGDLHARRQAATVVRDIYANKETFKSFYDRVLGDIMGFNKNFVKADTKAIFRCMKNLVSIKNGKTSKARCNLLLVGK